MFFVLILCAMTIVNAGVHYKQLMRYAHLLPEVQPAAAATVTGPAAGLGQDDVINPVVGTDQERIFSTRIVSFFDRLYFVLHKGTVNYCAVFRRDVIYGWGMESNSSLFRSSGIGIRRSHTNPLFH